MTDDDQPTPDADQDVMIAKNHAKRLAAHFDAVQLICTRHTENGTVHVVWGEGDWFSRYGAAKEWIIREEHKMRLKAEDDNG